MSCDPRTSQALIDALFSSGSMGLCLFDTHGRVVSLEGAASVWAPPVGSSIEDAILFVGMSESFQALRETNESILLSSVSIGSEDERAIDIRILWVKEIAAFAAVSNTATERDLLQAQVSQTVRDTRLLEQKIIEQQEKIIEQAELMTLFIRHVPAAVAMLDTDLEPMMLSQRWIEEFGDPNLIDDPDVAGSPLRMPNIDAALRMAMDTGVTSSRTEKLSQRGAVVWKRWEQTPWRRADRSVGGSILFFEDVTNEIRKTVRLRSQTEDLQKLNAEMRVLSRALTNDFSGPLRRIDALSRALVEDAALISTAERRERLNDIRRCVDRLNGMLAALRRYVQTSSRDFILTPFDLGEAAEIAIDELQAEIRTAGARIILHQMLGIDGDLKLMARVFKLLIDNALKHAGGAPTITIDCHDEDGIVTVRLVDDGPGVPAHLHARALEPFGRIDAHTAAPGDGMGLAEARKIVELHGGTMAIDPGFDLGLRVLINLPQHSAKPK